ncbi:MAG: hypothetical protein ABI960_07635, partial [Candidatus Eisenbacteria bacterium]
DARRLGMGGVILSEVSQSSTQNVAYRAVPRGKGSGASSRSIPIPLGLIQLLASHPEFDSSNPNFNVFEIAQLIARTPYTLQLVKPQELSSDIIVDVAQNSLAIDLGELQRLFPDRDLRFGSTFASPNLEFGTKNIFAGVRPQVEVRNSMRLDPTLQRALGEADPFAPNTTYGAKDDARAQGAIAFTVGTALPIVPAIASPDGDPRKGGVALYAGARATYLRGIALWEGDGRAQFATGDTIFGSGTPLEAQYDANVRQTPNPAFDAGKGYAADAGFVVFLHGLEIGLGVNDLGATIDWKNTDLDNYTYDTATNTNVKTPVARGEKFKSQFPVTGTLNLAYRWGRTTVAGTLDRTANERYIPRAGAEIWMGPTPLRGGVYLDSYQLLQFTAGSGVKFGKLGLDVALATQSRGISTQRGVELAASLAIY